MMPYPFSLLQHPTAIPDLWRTHRADQAARKREYDREALHEHTHQALQALLAHVYRTVPFYRDLWNRHGVRLEKIARPTDLGYLPIVSKTELQQQPQRRLMSSVPHQAWPVLSSGTTTGTRRFALRDAQADLANSLTIRRYFREFGVAPGDVVVFLHAGERKPAYSEMREREWGTRRVHLHVLDLVDSTKWMKAAKVIAGPAWQLEYVARRYAETGIRPPKLFVNYAERMSSAARERLSALTHVPITDVYCASELSTLIGFTCSHNTGFHVNTDFLIVEVLNERGEPCPPGEQGEVVVTDLVNFVAPLIRYRLGDVVAVGETHPCPCGRALSTMIERVEGRVGEELTIGDRRFSVYPLLEQLEARAGSPFTLMQESSSELLLKVYVTDGSTSRLTNQAFKELLQPFCGGEMRAEVLPISYPETLYSSAKVQSFVSRLKEPGV